MANKIKYEFTQQEAFQTLTDYLTYKQAKITTAIRPDQSKQKSAPIGVFLKIKRTLRAEWMR
jgi:hypothetical protein